MDRPDENNPYAVTRNSRPQLDMGPYDLRLDMRRRPLTAAWSLAAPVLPAAIAIGVESAFLGSTAILRDAVGIGMVATLVYLAVAFMAVEALFHGEDARRSAAYARTAPSLARDLLRAARLDEAEIRRRLEALEAIVDDRRRETAAIRRRTLAGIAAVSNAHARAAAELGSAPTRGLDADAAGAVLALLDRHERDEAAVTRTLAGRDADRAPSLERGFSDAMARIAGNPGVTVATNDARANRILEGARRALRMDPDMVDDQGARIDALVDRHLPQLLRRHAEASRHARPEDMDGLDRQLAEGIDMVAASVEEGLARACTDAAADLRTEIVFLRSRRGLS